MGSSLSPSCDTFAEKQASPVIILQILDAAYGQVFRRKKNIGEFIVLTSNTDLGGLS